MQQYDTIIIGAGHNGLVCATYLARTGQRVLVLEASDTLGGLASKRIFHPGFKSCVAHSAGQFSAKIVRDLDLARHGYQSGQATPTVGLDLAGNHVTIKGDVVSGVEGDDVTRFVKYRKMMLRFAKLLKPYSLKTIPRIGNNNFSEIMLFAKMALKMRLLGKDDMREFMRIVTLPARDLMDENFDNEILKAVLSWDGLIGSKNAPRSPNHTILAMLYRMIGEHKGDHTVPVGGIAGLINALTGAAKAAGVEIKTNAYVGRILIETKETGLKASGVELADGEKIMAERIVSAVDPKQTFLDMVGVDNLEIQFTNRINRLRSEGYVAKLHLALSGLPHFTGMETLDGRMIIAPNMDHIEFAWDDAKYGNSSQNPVMEIVIPSLHDKTMAPEGQHVLSAHIMYVPHQLENGWTDAARDQLCERVIETIEQYAPNIRKQIIHQELLTPADLAEKFNVTGGHWHHGEFALDQLMMMRPTYQAAQYKTPISGLYLASAGSHPGGGLMGGPGHNAAQEILK